MQPLRYTPKRRGLCKITPPPNDCDFWVRNQMAACDGAAKNDGLVLISPPMELREAEGAFRITAKYGILIRNSSAQT